MNDPTHEEKVAALTAEYAALAHAMQTGVVWSDPMFVVNPGTIGNALKHLRVGINSTLVDSSALAQLLIRKGLITELEYLEALRDGMKAEVESFTKLVRERTGNPHITLG
jgi:hypothetical protein